MVSASYACNSVIVIVTSLLLFMTSPSAEGRRHKQKVKPKLPKPVFLHTESNYTHHKGERAILYCSIKNLGTKTIIWRKADGKTPLTIGTMTYIDDERFEVAHIDESDDWNLMISNITTADTGAYECQISATDKELRKEVYLNVKDEFSYSSPKITISGTLHVDKDSVMTLICNATGTINPPDHIDWFKDGQKITADKKKGIELHKRFSIHSRTITSTLRKVKADMGDTGTYVCRTSSMQVTSVKVNVLNTNKKSRKRVPTDLETGEVEDSKYTAGESLNSSNSLTYNSCITVFLLIISCTINLYTPNFLDWR